MSFLKNLFGNKNSQADNGVQATQTLNLSKDEAVQVLNLRKDTFELVLTKNGYSGGPARVGIVLDQSGSMSSLYRNGTVQSVVERLLPVALRLDDNGELDVWLFADRSKRLNPVSDRDFYQYVDREIMSKRENQIWGGTSYAPVMRDVYQKYVVEEPSNVPTFITFITDGNNSDEAATVKLMKELSNHGIFWQFIGIGHEQFSFLQKLDELTGRVIDNANFFKLNDINQISDEELYSRLMNEYPDWERIARQQGILR
ncbi:hypothetical protein JOD82_001839 [Paenibacillus sp. 1182]|uniref:vWA domain-containing protein n=1 Tax=Paenibacillus sp. 1182 TaxID=2806565 RepID=UPI001AEA9C9F|nr:VWA domain-containing protein [Paenibacillus sp. 1182]MBP1308819.1 hypothetical protein [Paenibacillus sp. 1182]